jgi:hypothetical protein
MNIIVIDYAFTSDEKLKRISEELRLNYELLAKERKEFKMYRIWIDIDSKTMIAYTTTKSTKKIIYTNGYDELFVNMNRYEPKPIGLPEPKIEYPKAELDIDSILDKISKFGIESLLKEEKDFLDNSSNE